VTRAALLAALDARARRVDALRDTVTCADWRALVRQLPARSVDLCLTDTPYGTTACAWDTVIDLGAWWAEMRRVMKPRGAVVMTASQPYTSVLVMSNPEWFRHEWVWEKSLPSGHLNAKRKPLQKHESVLVFGTNPAYFPQLRPRRNKGLKRMSGEVLSENYNSVSGNAVRVIDENAGYPTTILKFSTAYHTREGGLHPNQKPIALFDYLIRTYTELGALVLDPFVGSGTTAIAARQLGRHFIAGDISAEYVALARARLARPWQLPLLAAG
jgi:site-specific DNA-methyltransferase (adenine-specific)